MANLFVKVQRIESELGQKVPRGLQGAGTQSRVSGNGVARLTSAPVLIKGDARERQAVDNLAACLQRWLRAEHVPDRAVQDVAVDLVEDRIRTGHGCEVGVVSEELGSSRELEQK